MAKNAGLTTTLYTIGVILAVVMGIGSAIGSGFASNPWLVFLLVVIGLVVGFYNISAKEVHNFLIGTIALIIANTAANLMALNALINGLGTFLSVTISNFIIVAAAAAVVVSFKAIYAIAK